MKHLILLFRLSIILILINSQAYSANEFYRSTNSGNWNSISTWQMSTNSGGTWIAATGAPTDTSGSITIQSPNTVTVTVSVSADQITVNNGGTISVNSLIVFTLKDGPGEDLRLNPGGIISGSGTFQTQGTDVLMVIRSGSTFSTSLKVNSGKLSSYDDSPPYTAVFRGAVTVDAGAVMNVQPGGYTVQITGVLTNNGDITTGSPSGSFYLSGTSVVNNDSVKASNLYFDDTTSLSGSGAYTSATVTIAGTGRVSLANNLTFNPNNFSVNNGGVLNPNTRTFTINSGQFNLYSGGEVSNSGLFQTQGTVTMIIQGGSNFRPPLKVNTGSIFSYDNSPPYTANYLNSVTVDAGATFTTQPGGYTNKVFGNITNNGTISGNQFTMRGSSLINNGSVNPVTLNFDSVTSVSGTGSYTSTNINVNGTGNITLQNNITFSPASFFTINSGGIFNPGSKTFTFNSGTFLVNTGGTVSGSGPSAGVLQTQGTVYFIFRNGSIFNSAVKVNTGTLTAYNDNPPYYAVYYGTITVDAGATMNVQSGGYTAQANNSVTNNGTITGSSGAAFKMKGPFFANNGSITVPSLIFDSTTALSGTGTYTSLSITIGSSGNVSLSNNLTFSPVSTMQINSGGILNPNTRIFTFNSGTFYAYSGSTVSNSGTFQTQGTVNMIVKAGSNFNAPFKVNTGTTTSYDDNSPNTADYKNSVTVDAGAYLITPNGGFRIRSYGTLTNNGTINTQGGARLTMRGSSLVNNGLITGTYLDFDTTTSLSGTGTYTSGYITLNPSGSVTILNNVAFTPGSYLYLTTGSILNPNTFTFTLNSGILYMYSSSTVNASGIFQTQNNINLDVKSGSSFNAPLKVNTGTTSVYDDNSPYIGALNGTVTIDAGAVLTCANGGYTLRANSNVINNGTISATANPAFRMYGSNFTNNGVVSFPVLYFETGAHILQGTGSWTASPNIVSGSAVTLASNHQMYGIIINAGGSFITSTYKLSLTASNPVSNSGTFNASAGTVEYNGTSAQSISVSGITYNRLRINNSAGTSLPGAVTVNDTLSVILGDLDLNGQILTVSATGYLTETAGNTVKGTGGYLTTTRNLNAPSSLNVAGFGAVLTTAVNLGSTEIRRGHAVQNGLSGNTSILRYFDITPTTNTGLNATLVFKYDESELNGKVEPALSLFKSINSGTNWTASGGTVNTSLNQITLTGISSFSRWSASSTSPVASTLKLIIQGFYNNGTGKMNRKDTVRAYLRNNSAPYAIVDSAKAVVDSSTFTGSFLFPNAGSGTYFIQLKHRNAIETWSKTGGQAYTLGSAMSYDFTTAAAQAYGSNMIQVSSSPLRFAVYNGDSNQDGIVDAADLSGIENDVANSVSGYVSTDLSGDDYVDAEDQSIAENNISNSVESVKP
ncbi:MAG: hypothetical protein JNJ56_07665 [Ignavibacteria bacterium]|nr:hypothetical protein [Ignavibacteria bacterium]